MNPDTAMLFLAAINQTPGMTACKALALLEMRRSGSLMPTKAAKLLGITAAAGTGLMDALRADGYVADIPSADRRVRKVGLTDKGRETLETILAAIEPEPDPAAP